MNIQTLVTEATKLAHEGDAGKDQPRHDWDREQIQALFDLPFNDLLFQAQTVHRQWFDPNQIQKSTLLSIKTGGCPEDCGYCNQSSKFETGLPASKLMEVRKVIEGAKRAKEGGSSRYCMGAAWRNPKDRDMDKVVAMIEGVKELGMETCMTLGMLSEEQTLKLKAAGLDYYNHNVDTSEEYYKEIITTRTYADRLNTISLVQDAGINVCSGGIVGMGEEESDRAGMLQTLANLDPQPQSVPINMLVQIDNTPLGHSEPIDAVDFVRTIAVARILMPKSIVRLSAGREAMSEETQALCFFAGANSIFIGEELLTTKNPELEKDNKMFDKLGLEPMPAHACPSEI
ncbi:MAG: biotin synthase [Parvibaculaceae bacterium]|jgi:biotin synthase|nr:biotin synthase BioB [Parvibaculaceae bacterium]